MAVVYRAHDRKLNTDVVVKIPRRAVLLEPGVAERFTREVRLLVQLTHPHIVKIIDVGDCNGTPFAVLQYLSGGSLEYRLPRDAQGKVKPADPASLRLWLSAIAWPTEDEQGRCVPQRLRFRATRQKC